MSSFKDLIHTDYSLIHRLFTGTREDFIESLISVYGQKKYAIVNYLYFASAMKNRLFEYQENPHHKIYKQALQESNFFLADGIALQVFSFAVKMLGFAPRPWAVQSLNGTDLTPYILGELPKHGTVSVYLYNVYDPRIGKTQEWIEKSVESFQAKFPKVRLVWNHNELYQQRGKDISLEELKKVSSADESQFKLFLNCTGSPFQEIWTHENRDFFIQNHFIALNSGGFIDYISGFEKRAPSIFVRLRVFETLWRILINPRKNLPKFLSMF